MRPGDLKHFTNLNGTLKIYLNTMLLCGGDKIQLEHLSEVEHFNKNI